MGGYVFLRLLKLKNHHTPCPNSLFAYQDCHVCIQPSLALELSLHYLMPLQNASSRLLCLLLYSPRIRRPPTTSALALQALPKHSRRLSSPSVKRLHRHPAITPPLPKTLESQVPRLPASSPLGPHCSTEHKHRAHYRRSDVRNHLDRGYVHHFCNAHVHCYQYGKYLCKWRQ